jgi:hypothetical protein
VGREVLGLEYLRSAIRAFIRERDLEQFHSPKNLAMALSVEASEIVEHFQWLTEEQSQNLPPEKPTFNCEPLSFGEPVFYGALTLSSVRSAPLGHHRLTRRGS